MVQFAIALGSFLIACGASGSLIAKSRNAALQGFWCGVLLGPMGVLVAFRLDNRDQCYRCRERCYKDAELCPFCGNRLVD